MGNPIERPEREKDDIFSTPMPEAPATDAVPDDILLNRASYDYDLPEELIAQEPLADRAASRMMVINRGTGKYEDMMFRDVVKFFKEGDVMIVNNTKVIPARVFGTYSDDNLPIELLLIHPEAEGQWKVMLNEDVEEGTVIKFQDFGTATVINYRDDNAYNLKFNEDVWALLEKVGHTPLPPYIKNQDKLEEEGIAERYNTVYSDKMTSVAAPTAGLHFTPEILQQLRDKGVKILNVRLDVGLGTFRPVTVNNIKNHHMHTEHIVVDKSVIEEINAAKERGSEVVAVGTTSLRTLESIPEEIWENPADFESDTGIFIYPGCGHKINSITGLISNLHYNQSTLLMLCSVVAGNGDDPAGRIRVLDAYNHAVKEKYRFASLGDSSFYMSENMRKRVTE